MDGLEPRWLPTGGGALRWWDGERWTDHVVYPLRQDEPSSRRYGLGLTLLSVGMFAAMVLAVFSMGDPGPADRAGLTRSAQGVALVPLLCPGERMTFIELSTASGRVLWRSAGNSVDSSETRLGTAPAGFVDSVEYQPPSSFEQLQLRVATSAVGETYISFRPDDIVDGTYVGASSVFHDRGELEREARRNTPCDDPYGDRLQRRIMIIGGIPTVALVLAGVVLLVTDRRRIERLRSPVRPE